MTIAPDLVAAFAPVAGLLDRMGVTWYIGGSVASTALGLPRATMDIDVVTNIRASQAARVAQELAAEYYVDAQSISDAADARGSFNLIHLGTGMKVDVFVAKDTPYARSAAARRVTHEFADPSGALRVWLASAEDTVLAKLDWFRQGGESSERQWRDVIGVLRVQGPAIDHAYLQTWGAAMEITRLVDRAIDEARRS